MNSQKETLAMKKVLLIDDDFVFTSIAEKASHEFGFKIESVASVKKFKARKLESFDAFLVDYDLTDGTGDQILEHLLQQKIDRPVVMISATNHVEDINSEVELQPFYFVSKWQDTNSFFQQIQKLFYENENKSIKGI